MKPKATIHQYSNILLAKLHNRRIRIERDDDGSYFLSFKNLLDKGIENPDASSSERARDRIFHKQIKFSPEGVEVLAAMFGLLKENPLITQAEVESLIAREEAEKSIPSENE